MGVEVVMNCRLSLAKDQNFRKVFDNFSREVNLFQRASIEKIRAAADEWNLRTEYVYEERQWYMVFNTEEDLTMFLLSWS